MESEQAGSGNNVKQLRFNFSDLKFQPYFKMAFVISPMGSFHGGMQI